jgi:hypothetical protein
MMMKISPGNGLGFRMGGGLNRCGQPGRAPGPRLPLLCGVFSAERQSLPQLAGQFRIHAAGTREKM